MGGFVPLPSGNNPYASAASGYAGAAAGVYNSLQSRLQSAATQHAALLRQKQLDEQTANQRDIENQLQYAKAGAISPQIPQLGDRTNLHDGISLQQPEANPAMPQNPQGTMLTDTKGGKHYMPTEQEQGKAFVASGPVGDALKLAGYDTTKPITPEHSHAIIQALNLAQPKKGAFHIDATGKFKNAQGEPTVVSIGEDGTITDLMAPKTAAAPSAPTPTGLPAALAAQAQAQAPAANSAAPAPQTPAPQQYTGLPDALMAQAQGLTMPLPRGASYSVPNPADTAITMPPIGDNGSYSVANPNPQQRNFAPPPPPPPGPSYAPTDPNWWMPQQNPSAAWTPQSTPTTGALPQALASAAASQAPPTPTASPFRAPAPQGGAGSPPAPSTTQPQTGGGVKFALPEKNEPTDQQTVIPGKKGPKGGMIVWNKKTKTTEEVPYPEGTTDELTANQKEQDKDRHVRQAEIGNAAAERNDSRATRIAAELARHNTELTTRKEKAKAEYLKAMKDAVTDDDKNDAAKGYKQELQEAQNNYETNVGTTLGKKLDHNTWADKLPDTAAPAKTTTPAAQAAQPAATPAAPIKGQRTPPPAGVTKGLAPGTHTFGNGQTWRKKPDGSMVYISGGK